MQEIEMVCTLNEPEYKEYELLINGKTVGVIAWASGLHALEGFWYTIARNGQPHYFQTQEEILDFLLNDR
jgi:hypothetical protein